MFTDYLGAYQSLVQLEHAQSTYLIPFVDEDDVAADLGSCTFSGKVCDAAGKAVNLTVWRVEDTSNEVGIQFPDLTKGSYTWEVMATDDSGASTRLIYGRLLVQSTALGLNGGVPNSARRLQVRLPSDGTKRLQAIWLSSSLAEIAVREVQRLINELDNSTQEALDALAEAQGGISGAITEAEEALDKANEAAEKLDDFDETLARLLNDFKVEIGRQVQIDPETGVLIIGGASSGVSLFGKDGQDGKSPYISPAGTFVEWRNGEWVDTGVRAAGRDGIDGQVVRLIRVNSVADIPMEGPTCNGGFKYYVPNAGGTYDVYKWLEPSGWVKTGEGNDIATSEIYGLSKLATDLEVAEGAPVGANSQGQLSVPIATPDTPGASRPACWDALEDDTSGAVGLTNDGRLRAEAATNSRFGATKLSAGEIIPIGSLIGINQQGQIVCRLADYMVYGGVCFGTANRITPNDAPHVVTIAKCDGDTRFNQWAGNMENSMNINLAQLGCLRYDASGPNGENTGNSLYLSHDETLNINEEGEATILPYLSENYYPKTSLYAREQTYSQEEVDRMLKDQKDTIIQEIQSWVNSNSYISKSDLATALHNYVRTSGSVTELHALTPEEAASLEMRIETGLYLS